MAGTLAQILATKADLENGKLKTNQIPEGIGITLDDVKADNDIASTLSLKHSNSTDHAPGSDNQDLSGFVTKVTGHSLVPDADITKLAGLPKITISATPPETPQTNDIWIQTS
jgi:hypothetical protein